MLPDEFYSSELLITAYSTLAACCALSRSSSLLAAESRLAAPPSAFADHLPVADVLAFDHL